MICVKKLYSKNRRVAKYSTESFALSQINFQNEESENQTNQYADFHNQRDEEVTKYTEAVVAEIPNEKTGFIEIGEIYNATSEDENIGKINMIYSKYGKISKILISFRIFRHGQ